MVKREEARSLSGFQISRFTFNKDSSR